MEILDDSVNWLQTLDDLKSRLPKLTKDLHFYNYDTDDYDFHYHKDGLLCDINNSKDGLIEFTPQRAVNHFCALADFAASQDTLKELHEFADDVLLPYLKEQKEGSFDMVQAAEIIRGALNHAEKYQQDLAREQENLKKLIGKS